MGGGLNREGGGAYLRGGGLIEDLRYFTITGVK